MMSCPTYLEKSLVTSCKSCVSHAEAKYVQGSARELIQLIMHFVILCPGNASQSRAKSQLPTNSPSSHTVCTATYSVSCQGSVVHMFSEFLYFCT